MVAVLLWTHRAVTFHPGTLLLRQEGICRHGVFRERVRGFYSIPPGRVENMDDWVRLSSESLKVHTGESLLDRMDVGTVGLVHTNERYAVLSHGTQKDPIYNYFNRAALETFQWSEDEVYQIPSRYSAPDGATRSDRQERLKKTAEEDVINLPNAIRQTKSGDQFQINDVILWNVYNDDGVRVGQMAIFDRELIVPVDQTA